MTDRSPIKKQNSNAGSKKPPRIVTRQSSSSTMKSGDGGLTNRDLLDRRDSRCSIEDDTMERRKRLTHRDSEIKIEEILERVFENVVSIQPQSQSELTTPQKITTSAPSSKMFNQPSKPRINNERKSTKILRDTSGTKTLYDRQNSPRKAPLPSFKSSRIPQSKNNTPMKTNSSLYTSTKPSSLVNKSTVPRTISKLPTSSPIKTVEHEKLSIPLVKEIKSEEIGQLPQKVEKIEILNKGTKANAINELNTNVKKNNQAVISSIRSSTQVKKGSISNNKGNNNGMKSMNGDKTKK